MKYLSIKLFLSEAWVSSPSSRTAELATSLTQFPKIEANATRKS